MGDPSARETILRRIRYANRDVNTAPAVLQRARADLRTADEDPGLLDRFVDRLVDYGAGVHLLAADDVGHAVMEAFAAAWSRGAHSPRTPPRIVAPVGVPSDWRDDSAATWLLDHPEEPLALADLDDADGVLTGASIAIAETGTIVLDAASDQGRRALSLVPDVHVCIVRADQLVASVAAAVHQLDGTRPLTWISGGSATSDIELRRVEGVHGPRRLEVVVLPSD